MPPMLLAGTAMSALPELYKMFQGIRQINQGKSGLAGLKRPEYETPEAFQRSMALSTNSFANGQMPGENLMVDRANQTTANAFAQSKEAGNPFALIASLTAQNQGQLNNIGMQSANYKNQLQQQFQQALAQNAQYQDQSWQMNKFAPFQEKQQEFRDIYGAGQKNLYNGMQSLGALGTRMMMPMMGSGTQAMAGTNTNGLDNIWQDYQKKNDVSSNKYLPTQPQTYTASDMQSNMGVNNPATTGTNQFLPISNSNNANFNAEAENSRINNTALNQAELNKINANINTPNANKMGTNTPNGGINYGNWKNYWHGNTGSFSNIPITGQHLPSGITGNVFKFPEAMGIRGNNGHNGTIELPDSDINNWKLDYMKWIKNM